MRYAMRILASNFRSEQSLAESKEGKSDAAEQVTWASTAPHDQRGKVPNSPTSCSESRVCDNSNDSATLRGKSRQAIDSKDRAEGVGGGQ